jgi:hypothetical protein
MERTFNLDTKNFIAIADGYIPDSECDNAIKFFKEREQLGDYYDRIQAEGASIIAKKDNSYSLGEKNFIVWHSVFKALIANLRQALQKYYDESAILETMSASSLQFETIKLQKTSPAGGYHIWHVEKNKGFGMNDRVLVFILYLNNIEEGGETEFLHQQIRIKPKKGRIVFWPAGFPYVHRGNPPLKEDKYILTSWLLNS